MDRTALCEWWNDHDKFGKLARQLGPEKLHTADTAYAEIVKRFDVSKQTDQHAISVVLLKMISEGCVDNTILVRQCIAQLSLAVSAKKPGLVALTEQQAVELVAK